MNHRTPAERAVLRGIEQETGRALTERQRLRQRSIESYLRGEMHPRWMERSMEIERGLRALRRELADDRAAVGRDHPDDVPARWTAYAQTVRADALNELIRAHNDWYPIERDLPIDPRTGEYRVRFRRPLIDAAWVLTEFPV